MKLQPAAWLGIFALSAASVSGAAGVCSVIVPVDTRLAATDRCTPGYICDLDPCEGSIEVLEGTVQVVYRSADNRSSLAVASPGSPVDLATLLAAQTQSSGIKNFFAALLGSPEGETRAARYAVRPPERGGSTPAGQIAVLPQTSVLTFLVTDAGPGTVYVFHPQDDPSAVTRIASDGGTFRIDAALLPPDTRFRGALEGAPMIAFQTASEEKLSRVVAELEAGASLSDTAASYRRALVYFDNGLGWNARRELDNVSSGLEIDQ
jgi:hypothetical protein